MAFLFMLIYFLIINIITFFIFGLDKWYAFKRYYRVSEKILFLLILLGGFGGSLIAMLIFRHKIRKYKFFLSSFLSLFLWLYLLLNFA
ncbi:MAG TPA: DUF1294 domain-containing protein [Candidatus Onthousia faecavium]|nr:DUF1294 domain-containing protein [Candidatus Onthousia faecavium]